MELPTCDNPVTLVEGEALDLLRALPSASIDSVVTDPPYPCIDREYGRWTEAEWFALMDPVVEECRRVLKPTGSAVFVLQPNSERVGRMRTWLWEFMAKWGREWGMVQDAWIDANPVMAGVVVGLLRRASRGVLAPEHREPIPDSIGPRGSSYDGAHASKRGAK
jgi:hypothetical protein